MGDFKEKLSCKHTCTKQKIMDPTITGKKACCTEKILYAYASPNLVGTRKKCFLFGQVIGKICPHQFSPRPGQSDRGLGATDDMTSEYNTHDINRFTHR